MAQTGTTSVRGVVLDKSGAAVSGAKVFKPRRLPLLAGPTRSASEEMSIDLALRPVPLDEWFSGYGG
jgi:hypothetical protein